MARGTQGGNTGSVEYTSQRRKQWQQRRKRQEQGWAARSGPVTVRNVNKPPNSDIAAYATETITCRSCGARPGFRCVEQAQTWRTCCNDRFADAAAEYVPAWKDANGRR